MYVANVIMEKNFGVKAMINKKIFKSMLYGFAVGDALGVPVEFKSRKSLQKNPVTDMRSFGTYNQPAGTWSDDTSMTLATMESIARLKKIDYEDIMKNFSLWLETGAFTPFGEVFDCGITTRKAIFNFDAKISPLECGMSDESSNGNGSLMRILPAICFLYKNFDENFLPTIHNISKLTHGHLRSQIGCGIYSLITVELFEGKNLNDAIKIGLENAKKFYSAEKYQAEFKYFSRLFDKNFADLPENEIKSSGYIVHTLEAVIWCLLNTKNYKDLILKAVNLGEDTDTVAAIAGGLGGIFYGFEEIPTEWIERLQNKKMLEDILDSFYNDWA